jgi:putative AlgH/UPF0301 family transcriptional regulator
MSLGKRFPFAILLTIVVLSPPPGVNLYKADFEAPCPRSGLRAPMSAAALRGSYPASALGRSLKTFRTKGDLPALFLPIQFKNPKDLGVGKLLVASRGMGDPNFAQTVVLLVHYDENGVVGVVLNRRTDVPLSRVLDLEAAKDRTDPVYLGGPVGLSALVALFQSSVRINKAENIFGSVYLISDKLNMDQVVMARPDPGVFHVYVGYAGWTPDQLRAEVQLGAWFIFPADTDSVFNSDPNSLWPQMIQKTELKLAKTEPLAEIPQPAEPHSYWKTKGPATAGLLFPYLPNRTIPVRHPVL